MMEIIIDEKDFKIVRFGNAIYCFSCDKNIATYSINELSCAIGRNITMDIQTESHLRRFKKYIKENYKVEIDYE